MGNPKEPVIHGRLFQQPPSGAYYPKCLEDFATRLPADNGSTIPTGYGGPSGYDQLKCVDDRFPDEKLVARLHANWQDRAARSDEATVKVDASYAVQRTSAKEMVNAAGMAK